MAAPVEVKAAPWTLTFDVESNGLHGDHFGVGAIVHDSEGKEQGTLLDGCCHTETSQFRLPADDSRNRTAWIVRHVVPVLPVTCRSLREVRDRFWAFYTKWVKHVEGLKVPLHVIVDAGFPVETNSLSLCVADDFANRQWAAPFPLHEVQTVQMLSGYTAGAERRADELPEHNPLADARQSHRIWREARLLLEGT